MVICLGHYSTPTNQPTCLERGADLHMAQLMPLQAGSVSGQLHSNWWWSPDIGLPLSNTEHSPCTAPWSGTLCRTTSEQSRTMSPLDRVWKPGFSPDTSVFSALDTFVIIALYKSTFTIPYHCHSLSLASVKSRLVLPFWYQLTRVVLDKGPLNGCGYCSTMVSCFWALVFSGH